MTYYREMTDIKKAMREMVNFTVDPVASQLVNTRWRRGLNAIA
jgi:hypothetical protein